MCVNGPDRTSFSPVCMGHSELTYSFSSVASHLLCALSPHSLSLPLSWVSWVPALYEWLHPDSPQVKVSGFTSPVLSCFEIQSHRPCTKDTFSSITLVRAVTTQISANPPDGAPPPQASC